MLLSQQGGSLPFLWSRVFYPTAYVRVVPNDCSVPRCLMCLGTVESTAASNAKPRDNLSRLSRWDGIESEVRIRGDQ